jgi:hypothetical protein
MRVSVKLHEWIARTIEQLRRINNKTCIAKKAEIQNFFTMLLTPWPNPSNSPMLKEVVCSFRLTTLRYYLLRRDPVPAQVRRLRCVRCFSRCNSSFEPSNFAKSKLLPMESWYWNFVHSESRERGQSPWRQFNRCTRTFCNVKKTCKYETRVFSKVEKCRNVALSWLITVQYKG